MKTIDITPTWSALIPIMVEVLKSPKANNTAKQEVVVELKRLAKIVDDQNAKIRKKSSWHFIYLILLFTFEHWEEATHKNSLNILVLLQFSFWECSTTPYLVLPNAPPHNGQGLGRVSNPEWVASGWPAEEGGMDEWEVSNSQSRHLSIYQVWRLDSQLDFGMLDGVFLWVTE